IPVLFHGAHWLDQRHLIPLIEGHPNLHISFENFQINEGLEYFYRKGYVNQLIFASDSPTMSAGAHRTYVDYAGIPREARAKIAGGNLMRLLKLKHPPAMHVNKEEDILMPTVRQGKPLPFPVVDMHIHMLHEGLNGAGGLGYR